MKKYSFTKSNTIGRKELLAAIKVIKSGVLSKFIGSHGKDFYGGPMVQKFERYCEKYFNVKHAVTVNSWTSGLISIIGSIGIEPGDEVIVTPWTMCASATAILHWNAIPVFVDIEKDTFNINPDKIVEKINYRTKAIMTVDIFGHSSDIIKIMKIAKKHNLIVISDSAQAIGSKVGNRFSGTIAHVGGFSLNYHKHINTGEGGIILTNKKKIYKKLCLIRNHGEAVVKPSKKEDLINVLGNNFRLGEIESAIGIMQLKKLKKILYHKCIVAKKLLKNLRKLPYLKLPVIKKNYTHIFYIFGMVLDLKKIKKNRRYVVDLLRKEGVPGLIEGYQNVHLLPMYQKKIAYGRHHFPWSLNKNKIYYNKGICPVAEDLHQNSFFGIEMCLYNLKIKDINFISKAFERVWRKLNLI